MKDPYQTLGVARGASQAVRLPADFRFEGDEVYVKVLEIDRNGKIRLSRREAMKEMGLKSSSAEHAAD